MQERLLLYWIFVFLLRCVRLLCFVNATFFDLGLYNFQRRLAFQVSLFGFQLIALILIVDLVLALILVFFNFIF